MLIFICYFYLTRSIMVLQYTPAIHFHILHWESWPDVLAHPRITPYVESVDRNAFQDEQLWGSGALISLAHTWIFAFCSWRAFNSASFSISNISFSASDHSVIEKKHQNKVKVIGKAHWNVLLFRCLLCSLIQEITVIIYKLTVELL